MRSNGNQCRARDWRCRGHNEQKVSICAKYLLADGQAKQSIAISEQDIHSEQRKRFTALVCPK